MVRNNRYVYPLEGNESLIGQDVFYLDDSNRRMSDAQRSKESGELLISGPVDLVQGGEALLVRNPIYYEDGTFWGFTLVVIRVPEAFKAFGFEHLEKDGFVYEFGCYHEDGTRHIVDRSRNAGVYTAGVPG